MTTKAIASVFPWITPTRCAGAWSVSDTSRMIWRGTLVLFFSMCALTEIALLSLFVSRRNIRRTRSEWLHGWCRFTCRVLGVQVTMRGSMPTRGLLVCNHLSYLDIIILSAQRPCLFVAKSDVARWPLFGWLARAAGTIFVDRQRRSAAGCSVKAIDQALRDGHLVVLFPEGTSSDGATVLPFKSTLIEPATRRACRTTTAAFSYSLADGSVADEVCYWRDMTLLPHLLNLLTKRRIDGFLVFGESRVLSGNRKLLARDLRDEVAASLKLL